MGMSFEVSKRLKNAGYPQPEYRFGQYWYEKEGMFEVFARKESEDINDPELVVVISNGHEHKDGRPIDIYKKGCSYIPPVEELLQHPFFKYGNVGFNGGLNLWRVLVMGGNRAYTDYTGDNLADLLGTLLAEHLEKENNGKTDNVNG